MDRPPRRDAGAHRGRLLRFRRPKSRTRRALSNTARRRETHSRVGGSSKWIGSVAPPAARGVARTSPAEPRHGEQPVLRRARHGAVGLEHKLIAVPVERCARRSW